MNHRLGGRCRTDQSAVPPVWSVWMRSSFRHSGAGDIVIHLRAAGYAHSSNDAREGVILSGASSIALCWRKPLV